MNVRLPYFTAAVDGSSLAQRAGRRMSRYELYLLIHIAAAAVWAGGGFTLLLLAQRAEKSDDDAKLAEWLETGNTVSKAFIPASLLLLVMGVLMVVDGPWDFGQLWIALGLVGYVATFLTGVLVMEPWAKRIERIIERDGHFGSEAAMATRRFLVLARVDTLVVFLVIAVMVLKPRAEDVGVLVGTAAAFVAGIAFVLVRLHTIGTAAHVGPAA